MSFGRSVIFHLVWPLTVLECTRATNTRFLTHTLDRNILWIRATYHDQTPKNIEINIYLVRFTHSVISRSLYSISSVLAWLLSSFIFPSIARIHIWVNHFAAATTAMYARIQNGGKQISGAPRARILKIATHKVQTSHTTNRFDGTCSNPMNVNCIYHVCEYARGFAVELIRWMREKRLAWGTMCRWKSNNNHSQLVNWQLHAMQTPFTSSADVCEFFLFRKFWNRIYYARIAEKMANFDFIVFQFCDSYCWART